MSHTATCDLLEPHHAHPTEKLQHRSRDGLRAVALALGVLALTATLQTLIYVASGSAALLADLIHNLGDALTAVPIGVAFLLRSAKAERYSGLGVVLAIVISAIVAGISALEKLISRETPDHLAALALAGVVGVIGNALAARVRSRAGRKLDSPALIADGHHAKVDALVSLGVVVSSAFVGMGVAIADPIIALLITAVIGHIAWEAWETVQRGGTDR